jgi:hypothetical protein
MPIAPTKQDATPIASVLFSDVYGKYLNERKPAEGSLFEYKTVVNRFIAICGDRDIRLYSKSDMVKYKDKLSFQTDIFLNLHTGMTAQALS